MNTYQAFYKGKKIEVQAESQYGAQKIAAEKFGVKKVWDVAIVLVAVQGREIVHVAVD
jgi:hypothetical protein